MMGKQFITLDDDGYFSILNPPLDEKELYLALAELWEISKETKVKYLVPEFNTMDYLMWTTMDEKPHVKFNGLVEQLNWFIRYRVRKSPKSLPIYEKF